MGEEPRIGVFICECGGNISDVVDVEKVRRETEKLPGVIVSSVYPYVCSKPGIELIQKSIEEKRLNRVVIASCTPRMHQKLFREAVKEKGINPYLLERVNIREQCSWVHSNDKNGATEKAIDLVSGGIKRVAKLEPLTPIVQEINRDVLVIGGGIAGITASLQLANLGYKVTLVEREPTIGGHMAQFSKVFPTLDCAQCILTPKMVDVYGHPNITLHTYSIVEDVSGGPGNFHVKIKVKARGVDPQKCTNCGICTEKCPVKVESEFYQGIGVRKAIYIPFPQAVPSVRTIDFEHCKKCKLCLKNCPVDAINLEDKDKMIELDVGCIIIATGFDFIDLSRFPQYSPDHPNVITSLQMEVMSQVTGPTGGKIVRLDNGKPPQKIAYVLCVGSRDQNNGVPYCSRVCCMYSLKQSLLILEYFKGMEIYIYYLDIRSFGRGYEEFYSKVQREGATLIRGKVAEVVPDGDKLLVRAEDTFTGEVFENPVDIVVLCPALIASKGTAELAKKLKIPLGSDEFVLEKHPKLDPVTAQYDGIYLCGVVSGPKDIRDTCSEALGAAAKASEFLGKGVLEKEPVIAYLALPDECDGCGKCVEICPLSAISLREGKACVNPVLCNGCGLCVPECPVNALELYNYTDEQIRAQIEGILSKPSDEPRIIVFLEGELAYTAADTIGLSRMNYPSSIRFVKIPSSAVLKLSHILYAFAKGARGVMIAEGPEEGPFGRVHAIALEKAKVYRKNLTKYRIPGKLFRFSEIYVPEFMRFAKILEMFDSVVRGSKEIDSSIKKQILESLKPIVP